MANFELQIAAIGKGANLALADFCVDFALGQTAEKDRYGRTSRRGLAAHDIDFGSGARQLRFGRNAQSGEFGFKFANALGGVAVPRTRSPPSAATRASRKWSAIRAPRQGRLAREAIAKTTPGEQIGSQSVEPERSRVSKPLKVLGKN
jgi:hypothetical protein